MRQLKIQHQITVREGPALEKYLQEISKLQPLPAEREVELAKLIKQGDMSSIKIKDYPFLTLSTKAT